jgi:hypothetical protein
MVIGFQSTPLSKLEAIAQSRLAMPKYKKDNLGRGNGMTFDQALITRVLCVIMVAAVMLPAGGMLFPYVSHILSGIQFQAIEAVLSATLGFGISAIFA